MKKRVVKSKKAKTQNPVSGDISKLVPEITVEKMREILKDGIAKRVEAERERRAAPKVENGKCIICKGVVSGEYLQRADRDWMHIPIGPASQDCFYWEFQGYHCTKCGIKYEFLPPK